MYSFTERDGVGIGLLGILPDVIPGRNDWIYFVDRSLCGRLFRYGNEIFRGDGGYYPIGLINRLLPCLINNHGISWECP